MSVAIRLEDLFSVLQCIDLKKSGCDQRIVRSKSHLNTRGNDTNTAHSSFLQYVSDLASFDTELEEYVHRGYIQKKYDIPWQPNV